MYELSQKEERYCCFDTDLRLELLAWPWSIASTYRGTIVPYLHDIKKS